MAAAANARLNPDAVDEHVQEFVAEIIGTVPGEETDHITIAGRRAIQTVVDLCRRGYMNVSCHGASAGPHVSGTASDCLWIVNVPSQTELLALIATLAPDLRLGGTLAIGFEGPISPAHASRLWRVLLTRGMHLCACT